METESKQQHQIDSEQIQLIIARLRKVRRMQLTDAAASDEFIRVQERLESVITALEDALQAQAIPVDLHGLAQKLEVVEQLCASSRLVNVANVIGSVRESLIRLAAPQTAQEASIPRRYQPPAPPPVAEEPAQRPQPRVSEPEEPEDEPWPETHGQPLLVPLVLLCGACGACLAWVAGRDLLDLGGGAIRAAALAGLLSGALIAWLRRRNAPRKSRMAGGGGQACGGPILGFGVLLWCLAGLISMGWMVLGPSQQQQAVRLVPTPTVVAPPTTTPVPRPTITAAIPTPSFEEVAVRVPEEIALAGAALKDGDLGRTMEHFALAATLDPHHRLVVEMAESIVNAFLDMADDAMSEGKWDQAESSIEDAQTLARRFYLDSGRIDMVDRRFQTMDRFEILKPGNLSAIRAAVGHPVQLDLQSYETLKGDLVGLEGASLVLRIYSGIGSGGQVHFEKQIPLSSVREIRVFQHHSAARGR